MNASELSRGLDAVLGAFGEWVACLRHPVRTACAFLDETADDAAPVKRALRVWAIAFLLGNLLASGVHRQYGVGVSDVGFLATQAATGLAMQSALAGAAHLGFVLRRVPGASLRDGFVVATVVVAALFPAMVLLSMPVLAEQFAAMREMKAAGLSAGEAAARYLAGQPYRSMGDPLAGSVFFAAGMACIALGAAVAGQVLRALAARWGAERRHVIDAAAFGLVVSGTPALYVVSALSLLGVYAVV